MSDHGSSKIDVSKRRRIAEEEESDTIKKVLKLKRKIDAELEELEQQRNYMPYNSDSPFTKRIQIAPPNVGLTIPDLDVLDTFDGTGNPYHHVHQYQNIMEVCGFDVASMCKLFPLTLKDAAYDWYQSLSPGSIDSFSWLRMKFVIHFGTYNMKTTYSLMAIKQGATESLGSYIKRFEDATRKVAFLDHELAMTFLYRGLDVSKSKEFMERLIWKKPRSLYKMFSIARRCIEKAGEDDYQG